MKNLLRKRVIHKIHHAFHFKNIQIKNHNKLENENPKAKIIPNIAYT